MPGFLSVVAPLYNEEGNVAELVRRLSAVVREIPDLDDYELVLVNDGSSDRTLALLRESARTDPHVVVVDLSRNFGHQLAATAGLDVALGDAVVLIDADLQDPPELIPQMVQRWRDGYDVVYAVRRIRKGESAFKLFTARMFYRVTRRLTKVDIPVDTGDFRLMSRRVVDALKAIRERHRFIRGLVSWIGYPQTAVQYDRDVRHSGDDQVPVLEDAALRDRRHHLVQRRAAALRLVLRLHRLGDRLRRRAGGDPDQGLHRLQPARLHLADLRDPVPRRRPVDRDRHPGRVPGPASTTRSRAGRSTCSAAWSARRARWCRSPRPRTRRSPSSCARSRRPRAPGLVGACAQPAARSFATSATVRYWYLPRSSSGMSTYSMRAGRSSAANTAAARSFQVRSVPAPTLNSPPALGVRARKLVIAAASLT